MKAVTNTIIFHSVFLIFVSFALSNCSSAGEQEKTAEASTQQRTLTAPNTIQKDIQKAQQSNSLLELYSGARTKKDNFAEVHEIERQEYSDYDAQAIAIEEQKSQITPPRQEISNIQVQDIAPAASADKEIDEVIAEQTAPVREQIETIPEVTEDVQKGSPVANTAEVREQIAEVQQNVQDYAPVAAPAGISTPRLSQPVRDNSPILNAGETLMITVFNDEDLSGEYKINTQGNVTMPLLGDIRAAGSTQNNLKNKIEYALSANGILVDPKVSIQITALRPFYILGEVRNPGDYPTVPDMDVFKALAIAGGLTPRAVDDEFIIYRGSGQNRQEISAKENTPVLPGDSIKVKERFF